MVRKLKLRPGGQPSGDRRQGQLFITHDFDVRIVLPDGTIRPVGSGDQGPEGPEGPPGPPGAGITVQPAITNVSRSGLVTEQITALQNKVDETLTALRNAGVIQP